MTKDQTINILLLMATIAAYIEPSETTKKFDKLRKHFRKGISDLHKSNAVDFKTLAIASHDTWEKAKQELNDIDYTISVSLALVTLNGFISDSPYRDMFFTQKTFKEAIKSIMHTNKKDSDTDAEEVHKDSVKLSEMFAKLLGIAETSKLSFIKLKRKNNEYLGRVA